MPSTYRETELRINGRPYTVRTELGGKVRTVAQMEAAHFKAVKQTITDARQAAVDALFTDRVSVIDEDSERRRWHEHFMNGQQGPVPMPQAARMDDMVSSQIGKQRAQIEKSHGQMSKSAVTKPVQYRDATKIAKPWPKPMYKPGDLSWLTSYDDQVTHEMITD